MVPFLADRSEEILREICNWFILSSIMDSAVKSRGIVKIDILDVTKQKSNADLGFPIFKDMSVNKNMHFSSPLQSKMTSQAYDKGMTLIAPD